MAAELHLIGTLAQDPDGPERLAAVLADVRPHVVAVEGSRSAYERHRAGGAGTRATALAAIREKGAHADTLAFWAHRLQAERLHYETFAAAAYAAARELPLHFLVADGEDAEAGDEATFRDADGETLAALAAHDWRAAYAADYARGRVDLEAKACLEFLLPVEHQPAYGARDRALAGRVARLLDDHAAGPAGARPRAAVICNLTHLYFSEARLTIYSLLYEATTQRYITDGAGVVADHEIVLPWAVPAPPA